MSVTISAMCKIEAKSDVDIKVLRKAIDEKIEIINALDVTNISGINEKEKVLSFSYYPEFDYTVEFINFILMKIDGIKTFKQQVYHEADPFYFYYKSSKGEFFEEEIPEEVIEKANEYRARWEELYEQTSMSDEDRKFFKTFNDELDAYQRIVDSYFESCVEKWENY